MILVCPGKARYADSVLWRWCHRRTQLPPTRYLLHCRACFDADGVCTGRVYRSHTTILSCQAISACRTAGTPQGRIAGRLQGSHATRAKMSIGIHPPAHLAAHCDHATSSASCGSSYAASAADATAARGALASASITSAQPYNSAAGRRRGATPQRWVPPVCFTSAQPYLTVARLGWCVLTCRTAPNLSVKIVQSHSS
jgi:hypothetical protein